MHEISNLLGSYLYQAEIFNNSNLFGSMTHALAPKILQIKQHSRNLTLPIHPFVRAYPLSFPVVYHPCDSHR